MGAYHNNALNFCRDRKNNYNSPQEWFAGIDKDIIDFFCTETDLTYCDPTVNTETLSVITKTALSDSLYNQSIVTESPNTQAYIDTLWSIVDESTPNNYQGFKTQIIELENKLIQTDLISSEHKKMLLTITQVTRYSGLYWKDEMDGNFQNWFSMASISFTSETWRSTVKIDTRGGLIGYRFGANNDNSMKTAAKGGPASSAKEIINIVSGN